MGKISYLLLLLLCGCYSHGNKVVYPDAVGFGPAVFSDTALFSQLPLTSRAAVRSFYASRNFSLFWSDHGGYKPAVDSLMITLGRMEDWGLNPEGYHLQQIKKISEDSVFAAQCEMDALLTDAFLTLHHHLRKGRLNPRTLQLIDLSQTTDAAAVASLETIHGASISNYLQLLEPRAKQYHLLKLALRNYHLDGNKDSVEQLRARTIALNIERWRWQKPGPDRYVLVNIPAFMLRVFESDSMWLETPVIVGKPDTPTPILESVIRSFTIYPYWHVPHSIATREMLPSLQADASYLQRNNFEVLSVAGAVIASDTIQWKLYSVNRFPFILRQREGTENSMGIIKFSFHNNYNIYLHDTNSKKLFNHRRRALSHGCVRVKEAVALAHHLVRDDDIYVSPDDLDQYLSFQQRVNVDLQKPIAIKLEYFTAEVQNGTTLFYDDIYRKDSVMEQALYRTPVPSVHVSETPSF